MALANSLHNCLEEQKRSVKGEEEVFLGADMADRQVSDGRGKVLKRGTHGYGLVGEDAV